ncbi:MAG: OmpA family protein [Deltaproteobacteria bacterium]|nr:OmpA family protein [Deltaproteobacteria bacterium]
MDNFYVVLRYSPHETVILSKNGTFFRELSSSNHVGYQITGAAHIMLEGEPKTININGIELFTEGAHLFFHDLRQPAELKVVSGTMTMLPQQAVFLSKADQIEPQTGKIILTPEDIIKIKKSTFLLQKSEDKVKTLYNDTYLPGFTVDGEFRQVGYATIEEGTYTLERSEKDFKVAISTIPIMEHDTLKSGDKGKVLLKFYSDDHIRIYPQGKLSIVEFPLPEKYPILPLIIGVNAQQVGKTSLSRFRFKGKLRTKVNPKIKRRRFNLRSTQAMIAVKGTDFEASATEKAVEVLTLSGTVKLSDKDEKNAVIVSCGMMSQIQKGNLPEKPIPIPKDKLLELISDSLDKKEKLTLSSFNTADLNKLLLDSETPVSLFFNSNLSRANVILSGKAYPLEIINNSPELRLTQKTFADVKEEENAVQIEVTDVHGRTALFKANLKLQPHVKPTKQKTVFDNKIHFDQGKSVLNPDSYKLLNEIVELIKSNPKITGISIVGHADCDGSPDDNLRLSIKRAEAVRQYLIKNGIPGTILFSRGYGDKKPIADNSSVSGMKKNRRVEFIITQH